MSDGPTRHATWVVAALAVVAIVVIAVVVLVSDTDDEPDAGGGGGGASADVGGAGLDGACDSVHAGHNLMMWNAVMADEMLDADCGWPYPPFDEPFTVDADVAPVDQPFEPRRYDDLWQMLAGLDVGICQIQTLPDPPADGFVFGFTYIVADPGCPERDDAVEMQVREYASQPARDVAAREAAAPLVLGRWVVTLDGSDDARREVLRAALSEMGAVRP